MKHLGMAFVWLWLASLWIFCLVGGYIWIRSATNSTLPLSQLIRLALVQSWNDQRGTNSLTLQSNPLLDESTLAAGDSRAAIITNFLDRYHSILTPHEEYGIFFVALADKYDIDFRLIPAIAMQESGLCKAIPEDSFNCLGLGVHKRGTWKFTSYQENFDAAADILKRNYINQGLTTPELIMTKYTPSSNGSWASSVNQWMAEMRYDDRQLGRELKTDASLLEFVSPEAATQATTASSSARKVVPLEKTLDEATGSADQVLSQ